MSTAHPSAKAAELEAEAARLRAGFDDLATRIAQKVRKDREVAAHLAQLERQAATVEAGSEQKSAAPTAGA